MTESIASAQTTVHINNDAELFSLYVSNFKKLKAVNPNTEPIDAWLETVPQIENAKTLCDKQMTYWRDNKYFKRTDTRYKPGLMPSNLSDVQEKAMLTMCVAYIINGADEAHTFNANYKYDMPDGSCFFARMEPFVKLTLGTKFLPLEFKTEDGGDIKYY